jgi:hypothetical protein
MNTKATKTKTQNSDKPAKAAKPAERKPRKAKSARVATVPPQGVILADTLLPPELLKLPYPNRPVIWSDLKEFEIRHNRTGADLVYDLALQSKYNFIQSTKKSTVVPYDLELLMRLYDLDPSSAPWRLPDVREVFEFFYGPLVRQFLPRPGHWTEVDYRTAELALGRRYARLLGRADTATYRWIQDGGKVTRRLGNILGKFVERCNAFPSPHEEFERIAMSVLAMRGLKINEEIPLPTPENLRKVSTSGRRVSTEGKSNQLLPEYTGGAFA